MILIDHEIDKDQSVNETFFKICIVFKKPFGPKFGNYLIISIDIETC